MDNMVKFKEYQKIKKQSGIGKLLTSSNIPRNNANNSCENKKNKNTNS